MKLIHISDLHIGKRLHGYSLLEDQVYILGQIADIVREEAPDGVLIAGDVYDKAVPSAEAVCVLDDFLTELSALGAPVFMVSGNHDSPERLAFGARLMARGGVHLSPVYGGGVPPATLTDRYGPVDIHLLPFIKPVHVRRLFPDEPAESYTDALACAVAHMGVDPGRRSVLVAHQFVTGSRRCDSEELTVGGSDNVDAQVFAPFDYVALGHLHGPQSAGGERLRYSGSPLKYSFSEADQRKSVAVVELGPRGAEGEKCPLCVRLVPLTPRRELLELRGSYDRLASRAYYRALDTDAYIHAILTDQEDVPDGAGKLRAIYPNLLWLSYDNARTRAHPQLHSLGDVRQFSPMELFAQFYRRQNGVPLTAEQHACLAGLIERIWEEEEEA